METLTILISFASGLVFGVVLTHRLMALRRELNPHRRTHELIEKLVDAQAEKEGVLPDG